MSEQLPPQSNQQGWGPNGGPTGPDVSAQANADRAARKSQRPWYKKKRFIIPLVLVALFIIGGALGGGSKKDDTATPAAPAATTPASTQPAQPTQAATTVAPPVATTQAPPPPPPSPAAPAVSYAGKLKDDKLAGGTGAPGGEVQLSGWTVTTTPLKAVKSVLGTDLCTSVTLVNRDDKEQDYSPLSWKLQSPGGNVEDVTFSGEDDLSSGSLAPGGKVTKNVCFDPTKETGVHVLAWTPDLFSSKARGVWLDSL